VGRAPRAACRAEKRSSPSPTRCGARVCCAKCRGRGRGRGTADVLQRDDVRRFNTIPPKPAHRLTQRREAAMDSAAISCHRKACRVPVIEHAYDPTDSDAVVGLPQTLLPRGEQANVCVCTPRTVPRTGDMRPGEPGDAPRPPEGRGASTAPMESGNEGRERRSSSQQHTRKAAPEREVGTTTTWRVALPPRAPLTTQYAAAAPPRRRVRNRAPTTPRQSPAGSTAVRPVPPPSAR